MEPLVNRQKRTHKEFKKPLVDKGQRRAKAQWKLRKAQLQLEE